MPPKCKPKLLPWKHIREGILSVLKSLDCTETVSVPYGIQLAYSLHHSHTLRCMTFYVSTAGDNYVSHYDAGVSNQVQLWTINSYNDVQVQSRKFDIHPTIMTIMFVPQHRVFVGFCNDLHMRIFSDAKHKISELSSTPCSTTILCMAFNEVTDELITGGYGVLQSWKMTHVEIRGPLLPSRPIQCDLSRYQWVTNLKLDKKNHQLLALCDDGVFIINYKTNKQTHFIKNWHATSLSCCVFYRPFEYFITASKDGSIKVWNAVVFSIVHEFIGHHNHVTGLALHSSDPLLISSSKDGTIRIWRLDTLEETFRLDLGEMIYGLKLGSNQQLYCYTLQDIKIWNFNQFHHLFTPIQSCVHKLASVKSVGIPSRILCVAEDGSVRLLSSVSGTVITIIYPMATYQILTDIVYDPRNARIYIALATGEVLLFDSSTNPCSAYQLWVPHLPDDAVLCLALVKLNNALGDIDTVNGESIIFAGHCNGQITLMEAETVFMKSPIQAHCGRVVTLEQSHGFHRNNNAIGDRDYLLSIGTDKLVKLWVISRQDSNLTLTILYTVECQVCPTHVSMLGSVIALTMPNNEIKMYKVEKENGDQSAGDGNGEIGVNELTHHKDDNHTQQITALCSCPKLGLFASTSCDGSVKIWNKENQLVRELCLDGTVRGVCFANDRGDLLVGFQNHVSYIPIVNYLPQSVLEKIVIEEFPDEPIEEALEFNPDLQLWFDIHNLLALPTDLTSRHLMTKLLEKYKSVTTQETEETPVQTPSQEDIKRTLSDIAESEPEITLSTEQMDQLTALSAYSLDRITKSPSKIISTVTIPSTTVSRLSTSLDTIDSRFTVSSTSSVYLIIKDSELDTVDSFVQMEDEGKEDIVKEEEVVEKEKKTPWPIAPDGYIPNSVIRALMGYKPPPIQPLPVPWKLKPVISAVTVTPTEIEVPSKTPSPLFSDEPFEWASLSSSEVCRESDMDEMDMEDTVVDPSLPMATRKKSMSMTMKQKMFRKLSLKPVSEGISVPRWRKVEEEEEEETEEIEETVEEEVIPPLLIKISTSPWFPANEKVTKANVVRVLIDLLGKVTAFQYRGVCQALLDIYRELGLNEEELEMVIQKLTSQLQHSNAMVRVNSVKTLGELGLDRKKVIMGLLPLLMDDMDSVRDEATATLTKLTGIHDKEGLAQLLVDLGILQPYMYTNNDREVIEELAERYQTRYIDDSEEMTESFRRKPSGFSLDDLVNVDTDSRKPSLLELWVANTRPGLRPDDEDLSKEYIEEGLTETSIVTDDFSPWEHIIKQRRSEQFVKQSKRVQFKASSSSQMVDEDISLDTWNQMTAAAQRNFFQTSRVKHREVHQDVRDGYMERLLQEKDNVAAAMEKRLKQHRDRYKVMMMKRKKDKQKLFLPNKSGLYKYYYKCSKVETKYYTKGSRHNYGSVDGEINSQYQPIHTKEGKLVKSPRTGNNLTFVLDEEWKYQNIEGSGLFTDTDSGIHSEKVTSTRQSVKQDEDETVDSQVDESSQKLDSRSHLTQRLMKGKIKDGRLQHLHRMYTSTEISLGDSGVGCPSEISSVKIDTATVASTEMPPIKRTENWKELFKRPTAQQRKQFYEERKTCKQRREMTLPPLVYLHDDDLTDGVAGQRLLKKMSVKDRKKQAMEREMQWHTIESVPAKLCVHTNGESSGTCNFGVLNMSWTTGSPRYHDVTKSQYNHQHAINQTLPQRKRDTRTYNLPPSEMVLNRLHQYWQTRRRTNNLSALSTLNSDFQWKSDVAIVIPTAEADQSLPPINNINNKQSENKADKRTSPLKLPKVKSEDKTTTRGCYNAQRDTDEGLPEVSSEMLQYHTTQMMLPQKV